MNIRQIFKKIYFLSLNVFCYFFRACRPTETRLLPNSWKPRGVPVAHLYEHRASVNRLVSIPDSGLFASSSSDGCVKIWDASKMEGRSITNRSRQTYVHRGGPLVGLAVCEQGQSLASSASQSGSVFVLRIEPNSSKMNVLYSRQLDLQVKHFTSSFHTLNNFFFYKTLNIVTKR